MKVICDTCKTEFNKKPSEIAKSKSGNHYCSSACVGKSQVNGKELECFACGKKVWKTKSAIEKSKTGRVFCSHTCSAKVSNEERATGKYVYRDKAFRYKEHKCERCGYDEVVEVLQVHHIDRDRDNGDVSNLELLCPTCHMVEHFKAKDGAYKWLKNNEV